MIYDMASHALFAVNSSPVDNEEYDVFATHFKPPPLFRLLEISVRYGTTDIIAVESFCLD